MDRLEDGSSEDGRRIMPVTPQFTKQDLRTKLHRDSTVRARQLGIKACACRGDPLNHRRQDVLRPHR